MNANVEDYIENGLEHAVASDYAESAEASGAESHDNAPEAYTDREIAQFAALLSSIGVQVDLSQPYQHAYVERAAPLLQMIQFGEAANSIGINKSKSAESLPAWMRLVGGGIGLGVTALMLRREFSQVMPAPPVEPQTDPETEARDNEQNSDFDFGADFGFEGEGF